MAASKWILTNNIVPEKNLLITILLEEKLFFPSFSKEIRGCWKLAERLCHFLEISIGWFDNNQKLCIKATFQIVWPFKLVSSTFMEIRVYIHLINNIHAWNISWDISMINASYYISDLLLVKLPPYTMLITNNYASFHLWWLEIFSNIRKFEYIMIMIASQSHDFLSWCHNRDFSIFEVGQYFLSLVWIWNFSKIVFVVFVAKTAIKRTAYYSCEHTWKYFAKT